MITHFKDVLLLKEREVSDDSSARVTISDRHNFILAMHPPFGDDPSWSEKVFRNEQSESECCGT